MWSDTYRKATDPGPSVLLDGPGDLEVVGGAGGVALDGELVEHEVELPVGRRDGPHAVRVVGVIVGVVRGVDGHSAAVKWWG